MYDRVSIVILCYRRFQYVYSAIQSALNQNYPNIELIVSDDGSDDFPKEKIKNYIENNKNENISNVIIRQETQNSGTVKHLNHAFSISSGTYVCALAGDDIYSDQYVISRYVEGFKNAEENCYIEMAQTAMYDNDLEKLDGYFLQPDIQRMLHHEDYKYELFNALVMAPYLPSVSTFFKKEFFDKFGKFDENYKLIEDYPMHLRLAKEGYIIHYENFIAVNHRHGGISHGNVGGISKSMLFYYNDSKKCCNEYIKDNLDILTPETKVLFLCKNKTDNAWWDSYIFRASRKVLGNIKLFFYHPIYTITTFADHSIDFLYKIRKIFLLIGLAFMIATPYIATVICNVVSTLFSYVIDSEIITGLLQPIGLIIFIFGIAIYILFKICLCFHKINRTPSIYIY